MHTPRIPFIGFACVVLGTLGWSQGHGASESGFVLTQAMTSSGGVALSAFANEAQTSAGQTGVGPEATSPSYRLQTGVVWSAESLSTDVPILSGPRPAYGDKDGGENVILFGTNFQAAGSGGAANTNFDIDGVNGTVISIGGNTFVRGITPNGENMFDNAKTETAVTVSNLNGANTAPEQPYHYTPALLQGSAHAQVGKILTLFFQGEPNQPYTVVFGQNIPGSGFPVFPYDGQLEVAVGLTFLLLVDFGDVNGWDKLNLPLPDVPALVGAQIDFQSLAFDDLSLATGTFSNLLTIDFLP